MARAFTLHAVFRPVFRAFAKRDIREFAAAIARVEPPRDGGTPGGSLAAACRALRATFARWGYRVPFHKLGQAALWLNRGATRTASWRAGVNVQKARPIVVDDRAAAQDLAAELHAASVRAFEDMDRTVR